MAQELADLFGELASYRDPSLRAVFGVVTALGATTATVLLDSDLGATGPWPVIRGLPTIGEKVMLLRVPGTQGYVVVGTQVMSIPDVCCYPESVSGIDRTDAVFRMSDGAVVVIGVAGSYLGAIVRTEPCTWGAFQPFTDGYGLPGWVPASVNPWARNGDTMFGAYTNESTSGTHVFRVEYAVGVVTQTAHTNIHIQTPPETSPHDTIPLGLYYDGTNGLVHLLFGLPLYAPVFDDPPIGLWTLWALEPLTLGQSYHFDFPPGMDGYGRLGLGAIEGSGSTCYMATGNESHGTSENTIKMRQISAGGGSYSVGAAVTQTPFPSFTGLFPSVQRMRWDGTTVVTIVGIPVSSGTPVQLAVISGTNTAEMIGPPTDGGTPLGSPNVLGLTHILSAGSDLVAAFTSFTPPSTSVLWYVRRTSGVWDTAALPLGIETLIVSEPDTTNEEDNQVRWVIDSFSGGFRHGVIGGRPCPGPTCMATEHITFLTTDTTLTRTFVVPADALTVTVSMFNGLPGDPDEDVDLYLFDPSNNQVDSSTNYGTNEDVSATASAGTWRAEMRNYRVVVDTEFDFQVCWTT